MWKKCNNYGSVTFGSIVRYKGALLITLSAFKSVVVISGPFNFREAGRSSSYTKFQDTGEEFEVWEFDQPEIETTSVLKLIREMVSIK